MMSPKDAIDLENPFCDLCNTEIDPSVDDIIGITVNDLWLDYHVACAISLKNELAFEISAILPHLTDHSYSPYTIDELLLDEEDDDTSTFSQEHDIIDGFTVTDNLNNLYEL